MGVVKLPGFEAVRQRHAHKYLRRRRRGNGQHAVRALDRPEPGGNGRENALRDAEKLQARRRADDVGYRIERAYFVEMHPLDGLVVDLGLGLGHAAKDALARSP